MNKSGREIEAKFHVQDLQAIRQRLLHLGAQQLQTRHLERNWNFDTPDRRLQKGRQVLRLRVDGCVILTYKKQRQVFEERTEIELVLDNPEAARHLLEGLGFEMVLVYEKQREVFEFKGLKVMLDELPFGDFVEIEGPALESLVEAAIKLNLVWEQRASSSYLSLFEELRERLKLPFREATFANFERLPPEVREKIEWVEADSKMDTPRSAS
jgi:adenylate cyclase class 2